jgi:hypothetical protein
MVRARRAAFALLAPLLLLPFLPSAARAAVPPVTLTGTYELLAKDSFGADGGLHHVYTEVLRTPRRAVPLHLPAGHGLTSGTPIRVAAPASGATAAMDGTSALDATSFTRIGPASTLGTTGTLSVIVLLAYWTAPDSVTPAKAAAQLFGDDDKWYREVSYGKVGLAGVVTPWLRIPAPSNGRCYDDAEGILANARAKAAALGGAYDPARYQRTVVYFPRCTGTDTRGVAGWAYEPGSTAWLNGYLDRRTSVHEIGHNFGLGHARSLSCRSATGSRVALSGSCTVKEYGDPYDAMGTAAYAAHFTGYRKDVAGWLGSRKRVMTTPSSTFTLPPFEKPSSLPLVVVAKSPTVSTRSYWLEYRRPAGMDARLPSGATAGVVVHLQDLGKAGYLLDLTPRDATTATAVLGAGQTWVAPDHVTIRVGTVSSTGARVSVTGARPAPVVPTAPRSFVAVPHDARASFTWVAPASDGGEPVLDYTVTATPADGGAARRMVVDGALRATTLYDLRNDVTYSITLRARNSVGNSPAASLAVTPVEPKPSVSLTAPARGAVVSGLVALTASTAPSPETLYGISCTWFSVDGNRVGYGCEQPVSWQSADVPNGTHTVTASANDWYGHTATTAPTSVTVRNPVPSVTITSPWADASIDAETVPLAATASVPLDPSVSVDRVDYYDTTYGYDSFLGTGHAPSFAASWNVTTVYGTHRLVAVAHATNGLSGRSALVGVTVVHPPPTVTVHAPATASGQTVAVTADAAVTASGASIYYVQFRADGSGIGRDYSAPYETTWDTSSVTGAHQVTAEVVEWSGRSAVSAPVPVDVTNALPAVAITEPANGGTAGPPTVTVRGTAAATTGGSAPDRVEVVVDGTTGAHATLAGDGTWTYAWAAGTRYGRHTLTAYAWTPDGYRSPAATTAFTLVRPVPAVTWASPASGDVAAVSTSVAVSASVAPGTGDPGSIARVCYELTYDWYGYVYATTSACTTTPDGNGRYAVPVPTGSRSDRYRVRAVVTMNDGYQHRIDGPVLLVARPPGAPGLTLTPGDGTLTATLTAPYPSEPIAVTSYVVRLGDDTRTVTGGPVTFTGLANGATYEVSAVAVNALGAGPATTRIARVGVPTTLAVTALNQDPVAYGTTLVVAGALTGPGGEGLAGEPVALRSCGYFTTTCEVVANGVTGADGSVSLSFPAKEPATVSLEFAGTTRLLPSATYGYFVTVMPRLTATLDRSSVSGGTTVTLTGTSTVPEGGPYTVQLKSGTAWSTVATKYPETPWRLAFPLVYGAGTWTFRLIHYATFGGSVVSNEVTLKVS